LGIPLDFLPGVRKNVRASGSARSACALASSEEFALRALAEMRNQSDLELYRYVKEELYPAQKRHWKQRLGSGLLNSRGNFSSRLSDFGLYRLSRLYYRVCLYYFRSYGRRSTPIDNRDLSKTCDFFGEYVF
jgi:hypothetical protein